MVVHYSSINNRREKDNQGKTHSRNCKMVETSVKLHSLDMSSNLGTHLIVPLNFVTFLPEYVF